LASTYKRQVDDVELGVELAQQLGAVALEHPRGHGARTHAERDAAVEREGLVLAEEVVRRGMCAVDRALLDRIDDAEGGNEFATRVDRDHELAAGGVRDVLGEGFAGAIDGFERFGEARCQPPADLLLGMDDGRCRTGGQNAGHAGALQEFAAFHVRLLC